MLLLRPRSKVTAEKSHIGLCYACALNPQQFFLITSLLETSPFADQAMSNSPPRQWKIHFLNWTCFWRPFKIKGLSLYLAEGAETIPSTDPAVGAIASSKGAIAKSWQTEAGERNHAQPSQYFCTDCPAIAWDFWTLRSEGFALPFLSTLVYL